MELRKIKPASMARAVHSLMQMLSENGTEDGKETVRFYEETKRYLLRFAEENGSKVIPEKVKLLPMLNPKDFDYRGSRNSFFSLFSREGVYGVIKDENLRRRLKEINQTLNSILDLVENPEIERMDQNP